LKTLEEPPAHVKFIFATTAPQKVPATILSRCQRFDFRRISAACIAETLREICKKEKIKTDDEALFAVARAADGSLRDAESILDQVASSAGGRISAGDVVGALGFLQEEALVELTDALGRGDAKSALLLLNKVLSEGRDPGLFLEKLLEHVRNLLFLKVSEELAGLVDAADAYKKDLLRQREAFSREDLFYFFSVITHTLQTMRRFESKRIPLEIALIKLAQRTPLESLAGILERLRDSEKRVSMPTSPPPPGPAPRPRPPAPPPGPKTGGPADPDVEEELPAGDIEGEPLREKKPVALESVWQPLLRALKAEKISVASYLAEGEPAELKAGVVKILFPEKFNFHRECLEADDNRALIEKHLSSFLERPVRIEFETVKELSGSAPAEPAEWVKSAMGLFGGKIIKE
jgi:DNA polymerase-3 subunit gamma/tau